MHDFSHMSLPKKLKYLLDLDQQLLEKYAEKYWVWMIAGDDTQLIELDSGNESVIDSAGQACFFLTNESELIELDRKEAIAAVKSVDSSQRLDSTLAHLKHTQGGEIVC